MHSTPPGSETPSIRQIFVGATRAIDPQTRMFLSDRGNGTVYARYDVSVPPVREPGDVTWPERHEQPDPALHFLVDDAVIYTGADPFRRAIQAEMAADPGREAVIFVHGFNNTFTESLFRFAQIASDLDLPGVAVHYAWPSSGSPLAYARDRDSALLARDGLELLIEELESAGVRQITLVAHSMGAQLTMEALRQIAIARSSALDRIAGVLLISPDIDVSLFRAQAERIERLPQPFIIFSSERDQALRLSAFLTGEAERLGSVTDLSALADLDVTVLDVTGFSQGTGHLSAVTSPLLLRILGNLSDVGTAFTEDPSRRPGLLPGTVLTIRQATRIILSPVEAIGGLPR